MSTVYQKRIQMAYDENFYRMYETYLREAIVRQNHDFMFRVFANFMPLEHLFVVDLGCGLGEYAMYGRYKDYAGIDLNAPGRVRNFFRTDYHNLRFVEFLPFMPTAFVSLFSIECCHSADEKYAFYNKLFSELPSLRWGLVSGFFYENRKDQEIVQETGGITSFQTIEEPSQYTSPFFDELRLQMKTPSAMFGKDVVEIWKIFVRRQPADFVFKKRRQRKVAILRIWTQQSSSNGLGVLSWFVTVNRRRTNIWI